MKFGKNVSALFGKRHSGEESQCRSDENSDTGVPSSETNGPSRANTDEQAIVLSNHETLQTLLRIGQGGNGFTTKDDLIKVSEDKHLQGKVKAMMESYDMMNMMNTIDTATMGLSHIIDLMMVAFVASGTTENSDTLELFQEYLSYLGNCKDCSNELMRKSFEAVKSLYLALPYFTEEDDIEEKRKAFIRAMKTCEVVANDSRGLAIKAVDVTKEMIKLASRTLNDYKSRQAEAEKERTENQKNIERAKIQEQYYENTIEDTDTEIKRNDKEHGEAKAKANRQSMFNMAAHGFILVGMIGCLPYGLRMLNGMKVAGGEEIMVMSQSVVAAVGGLIGKLSNSTGSENSQEELKHYQNKKDELEKKIEKKEKLNGAIEKLENQKKSEENKKEIEKEIEKAKKEREKIEKSIESVCRECLNLVNQGLARERNLEARVSLIAEKGTNLSHKRAEMRKQQANVKEELINLINKDSGLEKTVGALELAVGKMGCVLTIFEDEVRTWAQVASSCQIQIAACDKERCECIHHTMLDSDLEQQIISFIALSSVHVGADDRLTQAYNNAHYYMQNLPKKDETSDILKRMSNQIEELEPKFDMLGCGDLAGCDNRN